MIYCVWYPSGGFGHFINAVLTLYGQGFVRPKKQLEFSKNGNSHNLDLVVPKYFKDSWPGGINFLHNKNYCILIDNGIDSNSTLFKSKFPQSKILKICYSDHSWPVVARTMIEKAMNSSIETELNTCEWSSTEPWVRREKYFLYLRDHALRHAWRTDNEDAIYIEELYTDYEEFFNTLNSFVKINHCQDLWKDWLMANKIYIDPVKKAREILNYVNANWSIDIHDVTDTWTQSIIYYYIWLEYGIEVPHNDFANFFTDTKEIIELIK